MRTTVTALLATLFAAPAVAGDRVLRVPPGFEVVKVAGPPLVDRPIVAAFDEKGRLYVADSSGSNENVQKQLQNPTHRVVRLEDADGDAVFDRSVVYADRMMFPEGAMWLAGSLYVAAPPHIWKLTDTDGDGKADKRDVWFDGKTLTGCANDLHGPYLGPDGWIYWTKGAFAKQEYTLDVPPLSPFGRGAGGEGKKKLATRAAHIFRARPDGSGLEPVMTGGMDNPVDVVFTPAGERIFSTTFFQHPADGKRDGLVHAAYGGVYGKDHDPAHEHPWTSPHLMPVLTHMGPAAPAGLHRYESDQFGPAFTNNLFCAQFNLRKVSRHVLVPDGSTFKTIDSDFAVSDDLDFHPTDVIEDADGSLLVIDTGGWYKLCCPTSQLVKPDELGGIYRVRKVGAHKTRTKPARPPLPRLYHVALNRDRTGLGEAIAALSDADLHTRRLAAEVVGRIGDPTAVPSILNALADERNDRVLDHSLTYALIEIGDAKATAAGLAHPSPRVKRAAVAALAGIPDGGLTAERVIPHLTAADPALKETAWWVAGKHPGWGGALAGFLRDRLAATATPAERDEVVGLLAKLAREPAMQKLLADAAWEPKTAAVAFRAISRAGLKAAPSEWLTVIVAALRSGDAERVREAVAAARGLAAPKNPPSAYADALLAVGRDASRPEAVRLAALAAVPGGVASLDDSLFSFLLDRIGKDQDAARGPAADVLAKAVLTPHQLQKLAAALPTAGPLEVAKLLDAFGKGKHEAVGRALVAALADPKLRAGLRTETVKPILAKYPPAVQAEAAALYAALDDAVKDQRAKLETLLANMKGGDVRRGQVVFNSPKAACAACHKIGYVGGTVGPDLTKIGGVRTERDLLEAVVVPSASFVRSYEPVLVTTKDGRQVNGVLRQDAPHEIVLAVAADKTERIARDDIETLKAGTVSVMPAGLDQQLTKQELADLVAFLKACK